MTLRIQNKLFGLTLLLFFAGCNNGSLFGPTPSQSENVGTLTLSSSHRPSEEVVVTVNPDNSKVFSNDLGFLITLTEAQIGWKSLKIIADGNNPECLVALNQTLDLNIVEDLLSEDLVENDLGDFTIPLAAFCDYALTLGPAVADVAALTTKNHEGEVHPVSTFHLTGTWSFGETSGSFDLESTEEVLIENEFFANEAEEPIPHPLHFHGNSTTTSKSFVTYYDQLFQGVDFGDTDQTLSKISDNLKGAIQQNL